MSAAPSSSSAANKSKRDVNKDPAFSRPSGAGVNYDLVSDRVLQGTRHERENEYKRREKEANSAAAGAAKPAMSATFDAFHRMAAGLEGRTVADKISDPNRPTWEQYKKDNEDKLDIAGADQRKMLQYRAELDANRDKLLQKGATSKSTAAISDSEGEGDLSVASDNQREGGRRHRKKSSSKHRHRDRDKDRHRYRDRDRDGSADKDRGRDRDRSADEDRGRDRSRERDRDRERDRKKHKHHHHHSSRRDRSRS